MTNPKQLARQRKRQQAREQARRQARRRAANQANQAQRKTSQQRQQENKQKVAKALGYSVGKEVLEEYDYTAYIVGGGPSLKPFNWNKLDGRFAVAINRSYEVLPNAQVVYFTDRDFWDRHKDAMLKHKGQLIRGAIHPEREPQHPDLRFYRLTNRNGYVTEPNCLAHGSNSTYAALNMLAAHLGFKKIYLLGIDMHWGKKGDRKTTHWHSGHKRIDPEGSYAGFMRNFNTLKEPLKKAGVEVYNVSINSALTTFPKVSFEEVFGDDWRVAGRQGGEVAQDDQGGQTSGAVRKGRKKAVRVPKKKAKAEPVAPQGARRNRRNVQRRG